MSKKRRAGFIAVAVLIVLIIVAVIVLAVNYKAPAAGQKTFSITIDHLSGEDRTVSISTDAMYLGEALEQEGLIKGIEGEYGLFVTEVDGEYADEGKKQWWVYTKSGEYVDTSVDSTVIADGDSYEFSIYVG